MEKRLRLRKKKELEPSRRRVLRALRCVVLLLVSHSLSLSLSFLRCIVRNRVYPPQTKREKRTKQARYLLVT